MNPNQNEYVPSELLKPIYPSPEEPKISSPGLARPVKTNFMDRIKKKFKNKLTPEFYSMKGKFKFGEISPQHDEYSNFIEKEIIGEGSQGVVKRVINQKTNEEFAVKIIRKSDVEGIAYYRKEYELLNSMSHPNILKIHSFFVREYQQTLLMVMEYLNMPTLRDLMRMEHSTKNLQDEKLAAKIFKQMSEGVDYLHQQGVCHRDLKPENIFVSYDGSNLRIIDFGTAQYFLKREDPKNQETKELWSPTGTESYQSPEQICGKSSEKSDIYAMGLILYEMVTKKKPFGKKKDDKLLFLMERENYDLDSSLWKDFHPSLKILIKQMLCPREKERISASEVKNCEWIKTILG